MRIVLMVIIFNLIISLVCAFIVAVHKTRTMVRQKSRDNKQRDTKRHKMTQDIIIDCILTILATTALCIWFREWGLVIS